MNVALLCNSGSSQGSSRQELIQAIRDKNCRFYLAGIQENSINEYFGPNTAEFIPIAASRTNTNPLFEIKSIFSVKKAVRQYKIDSVIIYGVKNHPAMAIGAKLGKAKKIVCVVNGSGNLFKLTGIKGRIIRTIAIKMLRIAYMCSTSICFQNNDDRKLFETLKLTKGHKDIFTTGGSGVNLEKYPFSEMPTEDRFLYLARITPSKGIMEYIQAARIVKKQYPNAQFDIVGPIDSCIEQNETGMLRKAVDEGIVKYHGATKDVQSWMKKSRYFVYPSYYPEGVPRCVLQAMSIGRPIITCDSPGCRETVLDGKNGFVVPCKDVDSLAEKMIWMLTHRDETNEMGIESRKYAEKRFDVNAVNNALISQLYE